MIDWTQARLTTEPGEWEVELTDGTVVHLLADGYAVREGHYVFSFFLEPSSGGRPLIELETLKIAERAVKRVEGG